MKRSTTSRTNGGFLIQTAVVFLLACGVFSRESFAASTTYHFNRAVGAGGAVGNITTDGSLGVLSTGNIIDWDIEVTNGSGSLQLLGPISGAGDQDILVQGTALTATGSDLLFDFDASNALLLFQLILSNNRDFYCFSAGFGCGDPFQGEHIQIGLHPFLHQSIALSGNAVIATVPVPAAVWLFAPAMGLFAFRRRK